MKENIEKVSSVLSKRPTTDGLHNGPQKHCYATAVITVFVKEKSLMIRKLWNFARILYKEVFEQL